MDKDVALEDYLPELTESEREEARRAMQTAEPWRSLLSGAGEMARHRIEIAYLISKYRGRRNMWSVRDERERVENRMTCEDLDYLSRVWYSEAGKEHFRDLCNRNRARVQRTDGQFARLVAELPPDDQETVKRAMSAVLDIEDPILLTRDRVWDALCGSVQAQSLLGDCFLHGHEVMRDVTVAAFWLGKAAPYDETSREQLSQLEAEGLA